MLDPAEGITGRTIQWPRRHGPGSGKDAWVAFAEEVASANIALNDLIERQSAVIRELRAELDLLRQDAARRKPSGGRPPVPDETRARMEAELRRGVSLRGVARMFNVSAMTASRVAARMREREQAAE